MPASYIVSGTGELQNAEQVLTPMERTRLALARKSDTTVHIITLREMQDFDKTRPKSAGALTWHYTAHNVRDFAWATGPDFLWDASGYNGILIETLYRHTADKWPEANRMGRETIKYFSEQWYRYPYSHATTIEGPIEGMEYPMMTFVPNFSPNREDPTVGAGARVWARKWFPMIVGSNERLYPWMDEGFNTFIDLHNAANYFKGTPYGDTIEVHPLHLYADHAKPGNEQPLIENPTEVRDLFWSGYQKPALMLQTPFALKCWARERFDRRLSYLHQGVGLQASYASGFLSRDARRLGDGAGLVLAWMGIHHGAIGSASRLGGAAQGRRHRCVSLQSRHDGDARGVGGHL